MKTYYSMSSFLSYLKNHRGKMAMLALSFIISNSLMAAIPVFIGRLVGALAADPINRSSVWRYVIALIFCSTVHHITWRLSEVLYLKTMIRPARQYENLVFAQVMRKPYPYFVDKFTGKVASYVITLGEELKHFVENIMWNYCNQIVRLVAVMTIFWSINPVSGAVFAVGLTLILLVGRLTIRNANKYEKITTDVNSTKNGKIIDAIGNYINIKSFQKEDEESKLLVEEQDTVITAVKDSYKWNLVFWTSVTLIVRDLMWPITILLNMYLFLNGHITLTEVTILLSALLLFSDYIWGMVWNVAEFNLKLAKIEEAYEYLFGKRNIIKDPIVLNREHHVQNFEQKLELKSLTFAYPDKTDTTVLKDINLSIQKNEKVGIVGRSGSGKTTLTKVLLGYYEIPAEQVVVDGQAVGADGVASIISFVPQDSVLFHRTIAENIAYATDNMVTRKDVIAAAKKAHAHEFIHKIDEGYDVLVGERGVKLSTGQRQRIAIARAFLDDKPLLILDEATSALDSESEILVQSALEKLWQNKTVIAIAHRLSTLRHMDRIVVMDNGAIVETGSHTELIKKRGAYFKLWQHQQDGMLAE